MTLRACSYDAEVAAAVREGRWPQACSPELRAHVEQCGDCRDLVLVSATMQQARTASLPAAALPAPGLVWWRAQLRRRQQAVERAARPVVVVERFALAVTFFATIGLAFWQRDVLLAWLPWLRALPEASAFRLDTLATTSGVGVLLVGAAIATLCIFGGVAVYLVTQEK